MNTRQKDSALGVLVADAAALGLHWLYDLERMHNVVADKNPAFLKPNADNYEGKVGYFAHGGKESGELSHYGESYLLNLKHLTKQGSFNTQIFQQEFIAAFGPGGSYIGYIDSPTRQSLQNLQDAAETENSNTTHSGADDHQIPALTPVSALCAYQLSDDLTESDLETAIRVTNNNDLAVNCGLYFSKVLQSVLNGNSITDGFESAADYVPSELTENMGKALTMPATDLESAATLFGQVCGLNETMPLSAYILTHSSNYQEAVEMNILAGGDSCGRAMMLGALAGANYGIGGKKGIPHAWLFKLTKRNAIATMLAKL